MNFVSVRTIEGWSVEGKLSLGLLLMRERERDHKNQGVRSSRGKRY